MAKSCFDERVLEHANTMSVEHINRCCAWARELVIEQIEHIARAEIGVAPLREMMLDYPLRVAKGLRPAICLFACRALGGTAQSALPSATAFELLHNAFLIHDDVEDESLFRRGEPTLQRAHGAAMAMNVADGMLALALVPLLDNTAVIGLGPALDVLDRIRRTMLITVEGQAIELAWIRENTWYFADGYRRSYEHMVTKKTAHYSFISPIEVGAMIGGADPTASLCRDLASYAEHLGIAFQITDDLLNLRTDVDAYGKETCGDLWEGKRTLMLLHAFHEAGDAPDAQAAIEVLARPRLDKTVDDVVALLAFIEARGGIAHAREVAREHASAATAALERCGPTLADGEAREFLFELADFVIERVS
jgi:geranylgeranyl diphosphate synthase type II